MSALVRTMDVVTEIPKRESLGLYERLLQEREEEQRHGRSYGSDSPTLNRLLTNAPEDRPKNYGAHLRKLYRYIHKGAHSPGAAMQYMSLRKTCPKEYAELKTEQQGQQELL